MEIFGTQLHSPLVFWQDPRDSGMQQLFLLFPLHWSSFGLLQPAKRTYKSLGKVFWHQ